MTLNEFEEKDFHLKGTSHILHLPLRLLLILFISALNLASTIPFIYKWQESGELISTTSASANIPGILAQNLITSAFSILIFIIFLLILKHRFADEMYLKVKGKIPFITVLALVVILMAFTIYCLISKQDKITVLYNLFYYVFFIAFFEEFIFRDVFPFLLKDEKSVIRYLVPGIMFGIVHLFNYSGWQNLSAEYIIQFFTTKFLGLVVSSFVFQFMKEKSGTIWIPVLVHAIMDYSCILKLN